MATAVMDLEIEPRRYSVEEVAGEKSSRSAMPKPADQTGWPLWTTATETPGTLLAVMKAETAFSIWARLAGERVVSFSAAKTQEMTTSKAASTRENGREGSRRMEIRRNMCGPPERESSAERIRCAAVPAGRATAQIWRVA